MSLVRETPSSINHGRMDEPGVTEIWVRGGDEPNKLAKEILHEVKNYEFTDLACIGAATINIAVKAIAIARDKIKTIVAVPYFSTVIDDKDRERTRIILRVTKCPEPTPDRA